MQIAQPLAFLARSGRDHGLGALALTLAGVGVRAQCPLQEIELFPTTTQVGDGFGEGRSAVDGDFAIVGARERDVTVTNEGAAFVFERDTSSGDYAWNEVKMLVASDPVAQRLGHSTAMNGDTVVVGTFNGDAAYVFQRDHGGTDNWGEVKKLVASDASGVFEYFGFSVSISGDTILVGARWTEQTVEKEGAAYLFERNAGGADNWGEVKKLVSPNPGFDEFFGHDVAIDGDTAVVGAPWRLGRVYVYERDAGGSGNWGHVASLESPMGPTSFFSFGSAVALDEDVLVIGGYSGWVHERDQGGVGNWGLAASLFSPSPFDCAYGEVVGVAGDVAYVSDYEEGTSNPNWSPGAVYAFHRDEGGTAAWGLVRRIAAWNEVGGAGFGMGLAASGADLFVGTTQQGKAYALGGQGAPRRIRVDATATGANDGSTWDNAFNDLQDALCVAHEGDEVWVARGTYWPDLGRVPTPGDRSEAFELKEGVALYGGFGGGETSVGQRKPEFNTTVLSGDLDENDGSGTYTDNSCRVVRATAVDATAVLDGFQVEGGRAHASAGCPDSGGGIAVVGGAPTIANCTITDNRADAGGGLSVEGGGAPRVESSVFFDNGSDGVGGAVVVSGASAPYLLSDKFLGNVAAGDGGGVHAADAGTLVLFHNALFSGNDGDDGAGAAVVGGAEGHFAGCTFSRNHATGRGGGLYTDSLASLVNSIAWMNDDGGVVVEDAQLFADAGSTVSVGHTCVEGYTGGGTNHGLDPLFENDVGDDSAEGTLDDDLRLQQGVSNCEDAGDVASIPAGVAYDIVGNPRTYGSETDMGAYETVDYITTYGASGPTTNGCTPTIGATGLPNLNGTDHFTIVARGVEGAKRGLIFYGVSGPSTIPWSPSSTLLVQPPLQRTSVQDSGNAVDTCGGGFVIAWNALAPLSSLPLMPGGSVWAQGWFRDPPSSKTTELTNGLEFVVQP